MHVGGEHRHTMLQAARFDELLGIVEDDLRLVALRRNRVTLRARLVVEEGDIVGDDRRLERLTVLAWDLVVGGAKAPQAGLDIDPAEDRSEAKLLIRLQEDDPPRPFAFVVPQLRGEAIEAIRAIE